MSRAPDLTSTTRWRQVRYADGTYSREVEEVPPDQRPCEFEAFDCPAAEIVGEPGVGITFYRAVSGDAGTWLCWDETVALHQWLTKLIEVSNA